jgi:pimeloyl-ACP methyl ester carboxylesterase
MPWRIFLTLRFLLPCLIAAAFVAAPASLLAAQPSALSTQADAPLPRKGFLGAQLAPVTPELRTERKLPAQGGVLVTAVVTDTTAEKGGLKPQDVILKMQGETLQDAAHLTRVLQTIKPGDKIELRIHRDGAERDLTLTMLERPRDKGDNYEIRYDHVVSNGHRIRTIVSRPSNRTGKLPTIFFIQGIGQSSMDFPLTGPSVYAKVLKGFNDRGFATVRVDKPGLGDSEGGPFMEVDFERDVDSFRQTLKSLDRYDFIDKDKVFLVGHSMGGCHAPILGSEFKFRGIVAIGTVTRKWQEYMFENSRRQMVLAGASHGQVDAIIQQQLAALHYLYNEKLSPAEAKEKHPQYAAGINHHSPDGRTMSGMPLVFWRQVFNTDFSSYWDKIDTHVLALWGENEFIASWGDHPLIADIVNRNHPGKATAMVLPESDHGFNKTSSPEDSFKKWGRPGNEFNPNVLEVVGTWIDQVLAKG